MPDLQRGDVLQEAFGAPEGEKRHGEAAAEVGFVVGGVEVDGAVVVEAGAEGAGDGERADVFGDHVWGEGVAVDGPVLVEVGQIAGDVRAGEAFGEVGLEVEEPVEAAAGQGGVHAEPHLAGGDDVEEDQAGDLVGAVQGPAVGDAGAAVVADDGG